jgi:hypothetical protein
MKRCRGCDEVKPLSEFHRHARTADGYVARCKPCRKAEGRRSHYLRTYGLTEDQLRAILADQMGVCAICLSPRPQHVDHDHRTGRVRGILCFACNAALGQMKDQPQVLRRAVDYLEGNAWKPTLVAPGAYRLPS